MDPTLVSIDGTVGEREQQKEGALAQDLVKGANRLGIGGNMTAQDSDLEGWGHSHAPSARHQLHGVMKTEYLVGLHTTRREAEAQSRERRPVEGGRREDIWGRLGWYYTLPIFWRIGFCRRGQK